MEATMQHAHNVHHVGSSKHPPTAATHGSNDDGTVIVVSSRPTFGLDDLDMHEVDQPAQSDDFMMIFDEEESSGSQHSTSKSKEKKKKKKMEVTHKEFLSIQEKVDKILAVVTTPPQQTEVAISQSIVEWVERLETREQLAAERISLKVEMGIRALDNNRTANHKEFLANVERLIQESPQLKSNSNL